MILSVPKNSLYYLFICWFVGLFIYSFVYLFINYLNHFLFFSFLYFLLFVYFFNDALNNYNITRTIFMIIKHVTGSLRGIDLRPTAHQVCVYIIVLSDAFYCPKPNTSKIEFLLGSITLISSFIHSFIHLFIYLFIHLFI